MTLKIIIGIFLLLSLGLSVRFYLLGIKSQKMNPQLGLENQRLKPCDDPSHCKLKTELTYKSDMAQANQRMKSTLEKLGAKIVSEKENYLHAEFTSSLFGFVDDLEVNLMDESKEIEIRSESRVGKSDLGANQARIDKVSKEFLQTL